MGLNSSLLNTKYLFSYVQLRNNIMKRIPNRIIAPLLFLFITGLSGAEKPILGFTAESSVRQRGIEKTFDASLDPDHLRSWMKRITSKPNHVGSPWGKANAEFVAELLESWGYDVETEVFHVLFPTPKERFVELVAPTPNGQGLVLDLDEPEIAEDATSGVRENMLPPYNAYSADGDVEAELVYVNQGIPGDYDDLERMGIDVKGKIVLARYGGSWRGIKPKVAYEHGAIGCILYSDPRDDGYFQGDVYPDGPFRMNQGAQRGSVEDMPLYPGDPLTPGVGATEDAERYSVEESPTIMKIPVLPITYSQAKPLLEALSGPVAPANWRGALSLTYHVGPGPARVHMRLSFNWDLVPAYDVIARLTGETYPDEWVIRGNHRDGWVFGAGDPTSGQVAMLEEARAVALLAAGGHRPARTIIYTSWDAEEPGLLGSTEWVELHADELREKAVAYINTDGTGRGFLSMGGSHTLQAFMNDIAHEVEDPETGVSVFTRAEARAKVSGSLKADHDGDLPLYPLGSGSDYTPFLQHLGISSLNLGFGGESSGGSYHSIFDSFDYYTRFGDPTFEYGITLAKVAGRATLRLANADILPFRFAAFSGNVDSYLKEIMDLTNKMRKETTQLNTLLEANAYQLNADPTKTYISPKSKTNVPHINFAPLQNAIEELTTAAKVADERLLHATADSNDDAESRSTLNHLLAHVERAMTADSGLPRRSWFRHMIYAPGFYTGYGVKTLPGVREAVEERDWTEAEDQIKRVANILSNLAKTLSQLSD